MGRRRGWAVLAGLLLAALSASPAGAKPAKVGLLYGDSLVWESNWRTAQVISAKAGWLLDDQAVAGTAPCDWLARIDSDLAADHPATVTIATAGNQYTSCMDDPATGEPWPMGSAGQENRYRLDLEALVQHATGAGAKVTFVEDPPFADAARESFQVTVDQIEWDIAGRYHGVSIAKGARSQFSKRGAYVATKKCLTTETAAMGCSDGQIAVRDAWGLHFCAPYLPLDGCHEYSSGEFRFGKIVAGAVTHPPKPVMP